jgi:hypothetical protein
MRYLISVINDQSAIATPEEMANIDAFNDSLRDQGYWVMAEGLSAPSDAVVIDNRNGLGQDTPGLLNDTQEFVIGFWIVDAPDDEVAKELARQRSRSCHRKVELRPFYRE